MAACILVNYLVMNFLNAVEISLPSFGPAIMVTTTVATNANTTMMIPNALDLNLNSIFSFSLLYLYYSISVNALFRLKRILLKLILTISKNKKGP